MLKGKYENKALPGYDTKAADKPAKPTKAKPKASKPR
jgi:hypothetical protein